MKMLSHKAMQPPKWDFGPISEVPVTEINAEYNFLHPQMRHFTSFSAYEIEVHFHSK